MPTVYLDNGVWKHAVSGRPLTKKGRPSTPFKKRPDISGNPVLLKNYFIINNTPADIRRAKDDHKAFTNLVKLGHQFNPETKIKRNPPRDQYLVLAAKNVLKAHHSKACGKNLAVLYNGERYVGGEAAESLYEQGHGWESVKRPRKLKTK